MQDTISCMRWGIRDRKRAPNGGKQNKTAGQMQAQNKWQGEKKVKGEKN
jgi:hypothetical protein